MDFFGREQEMAELVSAFDGPSFEAILLYGRRRVGKTELIRKALSTVDDALIISCECKRASATVNLAHLSSRVSRALGYPADYVFASFDALFEAVLSESYGRKVIFVVDEFSFLLKENPVVNSSLSIAIDAHRHGSSLKLVLSGGYVDLMMGLVDADSPLYGRFTHIVKLLPFDYHTTSMFYPGYSPADKVLMYATFGGVPYFNSLVDPAKSAQQNILDLVIRKDSILEHEVSEMILGETNKVEGFNTVIELVGEGVVKYNDIVSRLSQDKVASPAYVLSRLQDMGILHKVEPINARGNRKRTRYAFADNLVHFYYRYVFRYLAERNAMTPQDFFDEFVSDDLRSVYLPLKFEELCAEALARLSRLHRIDPVIYEVGTYFFDDSKTRTNRQFDVVTRDRVGYTAYECKFTNAAVGSTVIEEEIAQAQGLDLDFYRLGFISKSGFADGVDGRRHVLLTLDDLYK